ncbi:hypothetical protein ACH5RR_039499 [Cinchona calisaya]|uniref:Uncharacterized protein n=1 Tax=Cinchona calisaya TaxID=153742 RepID=A0ABD2XYF3_9GENT
MGAKVTAFENRSSVEMEIRVFIPPARPDRYQKIFRIKPGEVKGLKTKSLFCEDINVENPTFLMIFVDGGYTGVSLYPFHVQKYAKIFGYLDESGNVIFKGIKAKFPCILRLIYRISHGATVFHGKNKGGHAKKVRYSTTK